MKIEWEYLAIIGLCVVLSVLGWQKGEISDIHTLFCIGGAILTTIALTAYPIKIDKMDVSNCLTQTALINITLGVSAIKGVPPPPLMIKPHILFVATATEEIFRIGAYTLTLEGYKSQQFAVLISGIVFAAMHMYWHPTEWLYAIAGGALVSIMLMQFGSQTACVLSHWMYDMLAFTYIPVIHYFAFSFLTLIFAQILIMKKVEVKI